MKRGYAAQGGVLAKAEGSHLSQPAGRSNNRRDRRSRAPRSLRLAASRPRQRALRRRENVVLGDRFDHFAGARRRAARRTLPAAAAALCVLALAPASALGAETVINFDEGGLTSGTAMTGKTVQGVTFGESPLGPFFYGGVVRKVQEASEAHSPPNVLETSRECTFDPHSEVWGRFAAPRGHVALFLGNIKLNPLTAIKPVTLEGFDLNGNEITSHTVTPPKSYGVATELAIDDPFERISFFKIVSVGPAECPVAIDDLSFNAFPVEIPPEIGISAQTIGTTVAAGASVNVTLQLHRTSTSTGPVSLAVSGLPSGVKANISPNPTSGPDLSTMTLKLSAEAQAPPAVNVPVTVTATPSKTAGSAAHATTFPLSVSGNFDLRAQGIEVTQGIQHTGALVPSGGESGGSYQGVNLVAYKKTAVRFYADAHGAPPAGIPGVSAELVGFRHGTELPGSPLYADYGPQSLSDTHEADPAFVGESERAADTNAFTFTLPASWTSGSFPIQLVASIVPPPPSFGPQLLECTAPSCHANDSFTENGITFNRTASAELVTIALTANGTGPVSSSAVFAKSKLVTPLADLGANPFKPNDGFDVSPYEASVDVSDIINNTQKGFDARAAAKGRVEQWASDNGHPGFATYGVARTGFGGVTSGGSSVAVFQPSPVPIFGDDRPLTAIAHELFHLFGLKHASNECGGGFDGFDADDSGQEGVPWPLKPGDNEDTVETSVAGPQADTPPPMFSSGPVEEGFGQLGGVGLDMSSEPYGILADGNNGVAENYDFMSYCAPIRGGGDPGDWVSPTNWEAVFRRFPLGFGSSVGGAGKAGSGAAVAANLARRSPTASVAALNGSRLRVIGYADGGASSTGFQITSVGPAVGPPLRAGSSSYVLMARGLHGQLLQTIPMAVSDGHADQVGPLGQLTAELPAKGVDSIQVLSGGTVVASRARDPHPPHVVIVSPHGGSRLGGGGSVLVRWRASDRDRLPLTVSVDYSHDGGRAWRTIFVGPNTGHVSLSGSYFVGSHAARVRVRANDGFNETAAVSRRFTVLGPPPQVFVAPTLTTIAGDARLGLVGQAFDEHQRLLQGRSVRWFDGPFLLGTGTSIVVGPLPPGANRIRLVARDSAGRTAQAAVTVDVQPVDLPFLKLGVPHRVGRHARTLRITASSSVPASLTVAGKTVALRASESRLTLRIAASSAPLLLHCSVAAAGRSTPFAVAVTRR
jgi:hypothetical protein